MLRFEFVHSPFWLLLCALLAAGGAWWMYERTGSRLTPRLKAVLRVLRFFSLFIVLVLLIEPILTALGTQERPPRVALLVDASQSMVARGDSAKMDAALRKTLGQLQQELEAAGAEVDVFAVGSGPRKLSSLDSLRYTDARTDLSEGLSFVQQQLADAHLVGAILVSDGIITSGSDATFTAERLGWPVHTVWVGDTTPERDTRIAGLEHNEIGFLNNQTTVRVLLKADGLAAAAPSTLTLKRGAIILDQKLVNLGIGSWQQELDMNLKLDEPGLQTYELILNPTAGERNLRNNRWLFFINVQETRIKVTVLANAPHPDLAALSRAFQADPRYTWQPHVRRNDNEFDVPVDDAALASADVFILHNWPAGTYDKPLLEQVYRQVRERQTPILYISGPGTRYDLLPEQQAFTPLFPARRDERVSEAQLYLDPSYREDPTYRFEEGFFSWIAKAPPLLRTDSDLEPTAGSVVYGRARIRGIEVGYPLFALKETQGWKSAQFAGEGIWRWRMHAYAERQSFDWFDDWMRNLLQWLNTRQDKRRFRVSPTQPLFASQEPVWFRGQVYDATYRPLPGVEVRLTLTTPDNRKLDYLMQEGQPGIYRLQLTDLSPGNYTYTAKGIRNGTEVGTDRGTFTIGPSILEYVDLTARAGYMRQIALRSGGQAESLATAGRILEALRKQANFKPLVESRQTSKALHQYLIPLLLVILLLAVEWFLRKRNALL